MACPIQCTCGKNIGELYPAFQLLYREHVNSELSKSKIHPIKQGLVDGEVSNIVHIFKFLNIKHMCCRNKIKNFRDAEKINYEYTSNYK